MSQKKADSSQALRSALFAWGIIATLVGIGFIVADYFVANEYISLGLMSLSSAALSIAGALLITEWIIKPLYVRDVLHVANLSAEIHQSGLRYLRSSQSVLWSEIFAGSNDITAATGNENVFRSSAWNSIMEASRVTKRQIRIHISSALADDGLGPKLEKQWRDNGCSVRDTKLSIIPHDAVTQGLIVQCGSWTVATLADDPMNDDPPFFVFRADSSESVISTLQRGIDRLNDSNTPPIAGA